MDNIRSARSAFRHLDCIAVDPYDLITWGAGYGPSTSNVAITMLGMPH